MTFSAMPKSPMHEEYISISSANVKFCSVEFFALLLLLRDTNYKKIITTIL